MESLVGAWFEGAKRPQLVSLRFEPNHAEVRLDASSIVAGIKMPLGVDPKKDYRDKVARAICAGSELGSEHPRETCATALKAKG